MFTITAKLIIYIFITAIFLSVLLTYELTKRNVLRSREMRSVWESSPLATVFLTKSKRVTFANSRTFSLFDTADIDGLMQSDVFSRILDQIDPVARIQHLRIKLTNGTNLKVWIVLFSRRRILMMQDVSVQRKREKQLQLFWGGVSHELRTPLTSILSHAQVANSTDVDPNIRQHSLDVVSQQSERLAKLVNNALELGRIKAIGTVDMSAVDAALVAEEAIAELILMALDKGVDVSLTEAEDVPKVVANRDQLKQVFVNLIENGIKYSAAGDRVEVLLVREQLHSVRCSVCDTGPGIESAQLEKLTDEFYRARRDQVGSGLGLAIVQEIIHLHNSVLKFDSETGTPNSGTKVSFSLEVADAEVQPLALASTP